VGGIIILTNTRTLLRSDWIGAPDQTRYAVYAALFVLWGAAVVHSTRAHLAEQRVAQSTRPAPAEQPEPAAEAA
jgi:hypothetical protein